VLARRLGILRASLQALKRIGQQVSTLGAKLPIGGPVLALTVDVYELLQD